MAYKGKVRWEARRGQRTHNSRPDPGHYARHGVKEYWIVDPKAKTVEVYKLGEKGFELVRAYQEGEVLESPLLPGLEVDLGEVFE